MLGATPLGHLSVGVERPHRESRSVLQDDLSGPLQASTALLSKVMLEFCRKFESGKRNLHFGSLPLLYTGVLWEYNTHTQG